MSKKYEPLLLLTNILIPVVSPSDTGEYRPHVESQTCLILGAERL